MSAQVLLGNCVNHAMYPLEIMHTLEWNMLHSIQNSPEFLFIDYYSVVCRSWMMSKKAFNTHSKPEILWLWPSAERATREWRLHCATWSSVEMSSWSVSMEFGVNEPRTWAVVKVTLCWWHGWRARTHWHKASPLMVHRSWCSHLLQAAWTEL